MGGRAEVADVRAGLRFLSGSRREEGFTLPPQLGAVTTRGPRPQLHNTPPRGGDRSSADLPVRGSREFMEGIRQQRRGSASSSTRLVVEDATVVGGTFQLLVFCQIRGGNEPRCLLRFVTGI